MKKIGIIFLVICCWFVTGCVNRKTDEKTITIWSGPSLVGDTELEIPQNEWIIVQLLQDYDNNHQDIEIEYVYFEDEEVMNQAYKGSIGTSEEPDAIVLLSGKYLDDYKGYLYPLNGELSENILDNTIGWENVTDNEGEILGIPVAGVDVTYLSYNKKLIERAGLDYDNNPPLYMERFLEDLAVIKKAGIQPIVTSDEGWNSLHSMIFGKWWVQAHDDDVISMLKEDKVVFSQDEYFIWSFEVARECYENGFINKDFSINEDAITQFINGKAAFYPTSIYVSNIVDALGDDLGVIPIPDYSYDCNYPNMNFGGSSQCIVITQNSSLKEETIALLEWIFNKENSIRMYKIYGAMSGRMDVSVEEMGWKNNDIYECLFELKDTVIAYPELLLPSAQREVYFVYGPEVISGNYTINDFVEKMDEK